LTESESHPTPKPPSLFTWEEKQRTNKIQENKKKTLLAATNARASDECEQPTKKRKKRGQMGGKQALLPIGKTWNLTNWERVGRWIHSKIEKERGNNGLLGLT